MVLQQLLCSIIEIGTITYTYWYGLYYYSYGKGRYESFTNISSSSSSTTTTTTTTSESSSMMKIPSLLLQLYTTTAATAADSTKKEEEEDQQKSLLLLQQQIRIHCYLLICNFYLYNKSHYRKNTYVQDVQDNFYNIAIPGTGIRLSYLIYTTKIGCTCITIPFVLFGYPIIALIAAIHLWYTTTRRTGSSRHHNSSSSSNTTTATTTTTTSIAREYMIRLLAPNDWFHYWRYNSVLVAFHAHVNHVTYNNNDSNNSKKDNPDNNNNVVVSTAVGSNPIAYEYAVENKWTFLQRGDYYNIAISPYMKTPSSLVIKHKNEEGGMGIYFYNNAACNTIPKNDWIIQERLYNSSWVASLLPNNAPLSTFRIITCSRGAIKDGYYNDDSKSKNTTTSTDTNKTTTTSTNTNTNTVQINDIIALSCVFRAGRQNASTDHDAIFFNVDISTGTMGGGTTNKHWYQVGIPHGIIHTKWRTHEYERTNVHPDGDIPITGQMVPNIQEMVSLVNNAHYTLCPHVPFCGWDIVLSSNPSVPICLLEVNLSCNFFRGTFDAPLYFDYMNDVIRHLQERRIQMDRDNNNGNGTTTNKKTD